MSDQPPGPPPAAPVLVVPDPCVLLLVGIAGCGKSTFAARHFAWHEVLSSDRYREAVAGDANDQRATRDAFSLLGTILEMRSRRRLLSVVDATNLRARDRSGYHQIAASFDLPVAAIVFDLPLEVCVERDARRQDGTLGRVVLAQQHRLLEASLGELRQRGAGAVHVLRSADETSAADLVRQGSDGSGPPQVARPGPPSG